MSVLGLDEQHALLKIVIERLERCNIPFVDLKNVLGVQKPNLDWNYVWTWVERFNLRKDLEIILDDIRE